MGKSKSSSGESNGIKTSRAHRAKDPSDLSPIFIMTSDEAEYKSFIATLPLAQRSMSEALFDATQLWGVEDLAITIFRLPSYVKWKKFRQIDNYLWSRCNCWRMYDETHKLIAEKTKCPDYNVPQKVE